MLSSHPIKYIAENFLREESASKGAKPASIWQNGVSTQLHGRRLVIARWICAVLAGLALGFFIIALPARLAEMSQVALQAEQAIGQLTPAQQRLFLDLGLGLSIIPSTPSFLKRP